MKQTLVQFTWLAPRATETEKSRAAKTPLLWGGWAGLLFLSLLWLLPQQAQAQTKKSFATAQAAIDWAENPENSTAAAVITNIEITGNNNDADLKKLKTLGGNDGRGYFPALHSISLPAQTGKLPSNCFYVSSGGNTWLKAISLPQVTSMGSSAFSYCKALKSISLPQLTSMGSSAFSNCTALTSISLPQLTSMEYNAFIYCTALTSISMPQLTSMDSNAFKNCTALKSISLPQLTSMRESAFSNCTALTSISLPRLTSMANDAFYRCTALISISLPVSLSGIGENPFRECSQLATIDFPDGNSAFTVEAGVLYNADKTKLISYLQSNSTASYTAPASLTEIGVYAFYNCIALESISLPQVTNMRGYAFSYCTALTSISLPQLTEVGGYAFENCTALTSISLPQLTSIGYYAFQNCSALESISFGSSQKISSKNNMFVGVATDNIALSLNAAGVEYGGISPADLAANKWKNYEWKSISIPMASFSTAQDAIDWAKNPENSTAAAAVTNIEISGNNDAADLLLLNTLRANDGTGYFPALDSISLPAQTGEFPKDCFYVSSGYNSWLKGISLPQVTSIRDRAFYNCTALTSISLPQLTEVGGYAFSNCTALTSISLPQVTSIGGTAFLSCTALESISLPRLTIIGSSAFFFCTALESISLPASLSSIGENPFRGCSQLATIDLDEENSAFTVEAGVLYNADKTKLISYLQSNSAVSYTAPASLTEIGAYAFEGCSALKNISLPQVTNMRGYAFRYCYALESISLPQLTEVGGYAFESCTALTSISLPQLTEVGGYAFESCTALTSISLPQVTSIVYYAFQNCSALESISFGSSKNISFGSKVFSDAATKNIALSLNAAGVEYGGISPADLAVNKWKNYEWKSISIPMASFNTAQEAIDWAKNPENGTAAAAVTNIEISGNNNDADLLLLNTLREHETTNYFPALDSISLPSQTGALPDQCFYSSSNNNRWLKGISLPQVNSIGDRAFSSCKALISISLPQISSMEDYAFYNCTALASVSLPASLSSIGSNPFLSCSKLTAFNLSKENKYFTLKDGVLYNADQSKLIIYLQSNRATSYTAPASLKEVGNSAFRSCTALKSISLPEVTSVGGSAFASCSALASISLPQLTSMVNSAFTSCKALKSISLPQVTSVGGSAFAYCSALTSISFGSSQDISFGSKVFVGVATDNIALSLNAAGKEYGGISPADLAANKWKNDATGTAYTWKSITVAFPSAQAAITWASANNTAAAAVTNIEISGNNDAADLLLLNTLRANDGTGYFPALDSISLPSQTGKLPAECFYVSSSGNSWLKAISLPQLTSMGNSTFSSCTALTSISLPQLTSMENDVFRNCRALKSISLPRLTSMGNSTFSSCTALTSISLPQLTSMEYDAFSYCSALTSISLPQLTSMEGYAFSSCTALESISLPQVTSMGNYAFFSCTALTSISLPASLDSIGENPFVECSQLATIDFPDGNSAFTVEAGVLYNADKMKLISYLQSNSAVSYTAPASLTEIGAYAFYNCTVLTSISLPQVTSVGNYAFLDCTALTSISFGSSQDISFGSKVFSNAATNNIALSLNAAGVEYGNVSGNKWENYVWKSINAITVRLASITLSTGELSPSFDSETFAYTAEVENSVMSISITAAAAEAGSTLSGDIDTDLPLAVGENSFTITVTAADGVTTQDYTVTVTRKDISTSTAGITSGSLQVYPNPVRDILYVQSSAVETAYTTSLPLVKLYSISGTLLYTAHADRVDMSTYAPGIYIIDVEGEKVKVVKE